MTAATMTEAELQTSVVDVVRTLGGMVYHTHDSRRSAAGFPDLVIVFPRTGALLFVELKSATGRLSVDQERWLEALGWARPVTGREVHLWRPKDWPDRIVDVLTRCARQVRR